MRPFATTSSYPMISLEEAWAIVERTITLLEPRRVPLQELLGLVLAEDIVANENMPPFATSTMDGYAVIANDSATGLRVLGEQGAGSVLDVTVVPGTALRIMTGAPLPTGADAVIRVEDTSESNGVVRLARGVSESESIRAVGHDISIGDLVIPRGTVVGPAEIGLLATAGRTAASAYPRPRVTVMATGDELVSPAETPGPGQIRDSNSFALCAAAQVAGAVPQRTERILDTSDALRKAVLDAVGGADMVLTSGGVSMGTRDLVKPVLAELGTIHFGRVAIKPGKPLTFAIVSGVPVFGLPGFPVSSLMTFENVVRPALRIMSGHKALWRPAIQVRVSHPIRHAPDRTDFQRAILSERDGEWWATTTGSQMSSRLKSLVGADALLRIPRGVGDLAANATVTALLLNSPEVE